MIQVAGFNITQNTLPMGWQSLSLVADYGLRAH